MNAEADAIRTPSLSLAAETRARCFVVEKELAQMQTLCAALEQRGYSAHGRPNAEQALQALIPAENDLLLVNIGTPMPDGIAFCRAARQIDPGLGLVLITEDANRDIPCAIRSGIFDFLIQPLHMDSLSAVIDHALESRLLRRLVARLREREQRQHAQLAAASRESEASLSTLSHDLRAPLRTISGFAQILQEDFDDALGQEGRRIVQVIQADTQKLDAMIVGLLAFSRASSQPFERDLVNMTALARSAAEEVLQQRIGFHPSIDITELPAVYADHTAMREVWIKLIDNAVKFSGGRGQPRITISGRVEGAAAFFQIEDNGVGFDMRHVDRIFGVFERLHRSEEFAGLGTGLAIVKRFIARHGGQIRARGAPDHGASFEFQIPNDDSFGCEPSSSAFL